MLLYPRVASLLSIRDKSAAQGEEILRELSSSSLFNELRFKVCNSSPAENIEVGRRDQICRHFHYEQADAGTLLAKQGSKAGLKLFFILRGTVGVYLETKQALVDRLTEDQLLALEKVEDQMNEEMGNWKGGNQKLRKVVQSVKTLNMFKNISNNMNAVGSVKGVKN